jgi:hypothetical protein
MAISSKFTDFFSQAGIFTITLVKHRLHIANDRAGVIVDLIAFEQQIALASYAA